MLLLSCCAANFALQVVGCFKIAWHISAFIIIDIDCVVVLNLLHASFILPTV